MSAFYYHGGTPILKVGDLVLPSSATGASSTADWGAARVCRRDRVYVATTMAVALIFAAGYPSGKGRIYEVEPLGALERDPDCSDAQLSFQCSRARVLRVILVSKKTRNRVRRAMLKDLAV